MRDSSGVDDVLLAAARDAVGFMPDDEGLALHEAGLAAASLGPLLEIGTYCGKSAIYLGAAARERRLGVVHRRPPPRLGGEPGGVGAPRRAARRPPHRPHGHAAVVPAHDGGRRARGRRDRGDRQLADRRRALGDAARARVHRRRSRVRRRARRLRGLVALRRARAACSCSTTCSRTRPTVGRRRSRCGSARSSPATSTPALHHRQPPRPAPAPTT